MFQSVIIDQITCQTVMGDSATFKFVTIKLRKEIISALSCTRDGT